MQGPVQLLRLLTCGSVDDGKSTLIGRLLYDSRAVFADQIAAIEQATKRRGGGAGGNAGEENLDLSLFTDGLRWEREQGITIDVAHRYFSTESRRFILIDCPGHAQYTRNMVTGASHADLAVILVDARLGVQEQTHRHAYLAALLGIKELIVAVNKMDLVGWEEGAYLKVRGAFEKLRHELHGANVTYVPVSALNGDNIVHRSANAPWRKSRSWLQRRNTITRMPASIATRAFSNSNCVVRANFSFAASAAASKTARMSEWYVLPNLMPAAPA